MDKFIDKYRRKHIKVTETENHSEQSDPETDDALHKLTRINQNIRGELDTLQKAKLGANNQRRMSDDRMSKFRLPSV
jgi:hypothetical protein